MKTLNVFLLSLIVSNFAFANDSAPRTERRADAKTYETSSEPSKRIPATEQNEDAPKKPNLKKYSTHARGVK